MVYLKKLFGLLFLAFIALALWQCAKRGSPSGGPKDVTPPELLRTEPENYSTNFKAKKIRLYFDELIKLEDVQNQLVVSPPFKYPAEITPMGGPSKYIEVVIKDTLRENTTYTINFGQSIVDNNEGNPNSFLTYVFSTGDYLDSLTLSGAVKDAINRKADEFISVMRPQLKKVPHVGHLFLYVVYPSNQPVVQSRLMNSCNRYQNNNATAANKAKDAATCCLVL